MDVVGKVLDIQRQAQLKSEARKKAFMHCVSKDASDALIVLPASAGRSSTFMVPAFLYPQKIFILIVLLVSLQKDLIQRRKLGSVDDVG